MRKTAWLSSQLYNLTTLINGFKMIFVGPMRQEEEWTGFASKGAPVNAFETAEVGWAEGKGTTVEQDGSSTIVNLPKSAAIVAIFVPCKKVAVLIDTSELEDAFVGDDEFLIHVFFNLLNHPYSEENKADADKDTCPGVNDKFRNMATLQHLLSFVGKG